MSERTQDAVGGTRIVSQQPSTATGAGTGARTSVPAGAPTPPDTRGAIEKAVNDHPLALLAGSLVMGMVAANLLQASVGRRLASRMLGLVAVAGELGAAAGSKTLGAAAEAGRAGQERLTQLGDAVAAESADVRRRARIMSIEARRKALALASEAALEAREAGGSALSRFRKLGQRK